MMAAAPRIVLITGEPSGDLHASLLVDELLKRAKLHVQAVGGERLAAAGAEIIVDSADWGAMGIFDVLRRSPTYWHAMRKLQAFLLEDPPDLLIPVNLSAFNLRLLKRLGSERRPKCLYYFPPASWDQNFRDRSDLSIYTDCVATPFPWSEKLLRDQGVNAHFVGHPVIDRVGPAADVGALRRELGVPEYATCLGLLPGSRLVERRLLGPQMVRAAAMLCRTRPELHVLFSPPPSAAGGTDRGVDLDMLEGRVTVVEDSVKLMQAADLIVTAFGTASLEATAALCPMIGVYRGTALMWLQFRLMKLNTTMYAMPNIMAGRRIVPETVEPAETDAFGIAAMARELLDDPESRARMRERLAEVRELLGPPGATKRVAELVIETLGRWRTVS